MSSRRIVLVAIVALPMLAVRAAWLPAQVPPVRVVGEDVLREYAGTYQWGPDAYLYLRLWSELAGKNQLVAFDELGEIRTLYPTERDRFFAGDGAAVATAMESTIEFQRDGAGRIASLAWQRDGGPRRVALGVELEKREDIQFSALGRIRYATQSTIGTTANVAMSVVVVWRASSE